MREYYLFCLLFSINNNNFFIILVNWKSMGKNSHIHLIIETPSKDALKKEASEQNIPLSQLCRNKLRKSPEIIRIENLLIEIKEKLK